MSTYLTIHLIIGLVLLIPLFKELPEEMPVPWPFAIAVWLVLYPWFVVSFIVRKIRG